MTAAIRQKSTALALPASTVDVPEPLAEPRAHDWDETPAEAAHYDDRYWGDYEYDRDEDE